MKQKIEAIDLFCGVGGLTYGLRQANIDVKVGIDNDASCAFAYENNNTSQFIQADVEKYDFNALKSLYSKDAIKVLVGCAPCQPFSSHSHKNKDKSNDKRWNLLYHFSRAINELSPDIVSMENVAGITKTLVFNDFVEMLKSEKYKVSYKVVNCPEYGIPQNRKRLVLLASRLGEIVLPPPTHNKTNYVKVKDIIKDMPIIKSGETHANDPLHRSRVLTDINIRRIKASKPKGTWRDWDKKLLPDCYKKESGQTFSSVYGRMDWNEISPTITTQFTNFGTGRFGHPEQDRAISLREGALLQTFPSNYNFGELITFSKIGRHIGNAVPPKLGEVIGKAINLHTCGVYNE